MASFNHFDFQLDSRQTLQKADFDRELNSLYQLAPGVQQGYNSFPSQHYDAQDMWQQSYAGNTLESLPNVMPVQMTHSNHYQDQRQWALAQQQQQQQRAYRIQRGAPQLIPDHRQAMSHTGYCTPNLLPTLTSPMPSNHSMLSGGSPESSPDCKASVILPISATSSYSPLPTPDEEKFYTAQTSPASSTSSPHHQQLELWSQGAEALLPEPSLGPVIPQPTYKPHTNSDRKRYVEEITLAPPLYFTVEHPSGQGIALADALHSRVKRLTCRDQSVFEGRGPSISIRLEWPGYRQWTRQIPTKDFRSPPRPITMAKLAKNVAKCVQRFIEENKDRALEEGTDRKWKVGTRPNEIKLEDLVLVSLHHVSLGSWQPQLRLRRSKHH